MSGVIDVIDIDQIKRLIPHRAPFLLIDRVENVVPDSEATGVKLVSVNEHYFEGHFPDFPVMPGVLIIEALAQTASVMVATTVPDLTAGKLVFFAQLKKQNFVIQFDQATLLNYMWPKMQLKGHYGNLGNASVDGRTVAEADFSAMIVDPDR